MNALPSMLNLYACIYLVLCLHMTNLLTLSLFFATREQIVLCCDILSKLLSAVEPLEVLQKFQNELLVGLGHPTVSIKQLCLQQVRLNHKICVLTEWMSSALVLCKITLFVGQGLT